MHQAAIAASNKNQTARAKDDEGWLLITEPISVQQRDTEETTDELFSRLHSTPTPPWKILKSMRRRVWEDKLVKQGYEMMVAKPEPNTKSDHDSGGLTHSSFLVRQAPGKTPGKTGVNEKSSSASDKLPAKTKSNSPTSQTLVSANTPARAPNPPPLPSLPPPPPPPLRKTPEASSSSVLHLGVKNGASLQELIAKQAIKNSGRAKALEKLEKCREGVDSSTTFCTGSEDYLRQTEETKFERYWPFIESHTFKSMVVTLTTEEIGFLKKAHRTPPDQHVNQIQEYNTIVHKIEEAMTNLGKTPGKDKVFVRLSTRSAKDAVIGKSGFKELFEQQVELVKSKEESAFLLNSNLPGNSIFNRKLHALYIASTLALAVKTGDEAIDMLIRSERIQDDLESELRRIEKASSNIEDDSGTSLSLIVREFSDLNPAREFRGFVYIGKLTAVTQYNPLCYFPEVVQDKDVLKSVIEEFMEDKTQLVPELDSYVVDLIVLDDNTVRIIELNPFVENAGSGLFDWHKTEDMKVLTGQKNLEFRIVSKLPDKPWVIGSINKDYKKMLDDQTGR